MNDIVLNKAIVPEELIVGITDDLCYITYYQGKKLNSEKSWTSWSKNSKKPLKIKNKFQKGYSLGGVNGRYSRQASNQENLLIKHPEFKKSWEISLGRFIDIAKRTTIINGVFQDEFIVDNNRNILFRDEYEKLLEEQLKIEEKEKIKKEQIKNIKQISSSVKDQIPGRWYKDVEKDELFLYLGTMEIDGKIKHIYHKKTTKCNPNIPIETVRFYLSTYINGKSKKSYSNREFKVPTILYNGGGYCNNENDFNDNIYLSQPAKYNVSIVTSKKKLIAIPESENDFFKLYTEDMWKDIIRCMEKKEYTGIFTGDIRKCNFHTEYLKSLV